MTLPHINPHAAREILDLLHRADTVLATVAHPDDLTDVDIDVLTTVLVKPALRDAMADVAQDGRRTALWVTVAYQADDPAVAADALTLAALAAPTPSRQVDLLAEAQGWAPGHELSALLLELAIAGKDLAGPVVCGALAARTDLEGLAGAVAPGRR